MTSLEGLHAPEFTLKNESGEDVSLSDFAGKKYIIFHIRTFFNCYLSVIFPLFQWDMIHIVTHNCLLQD